MPVPSSINDLSTTAGSNSPAGTESPNTTDDYLRSHASFIAGLRDSKAADADVVKLTGNQTVAGTKTFSSTISGSIDGNAGTVTNGVYTTGDQTVGGVKAFSSAPVSANGYTLSSAGWRVTESAGVLYFAHNGVNRAKLDSSGNLTVAGNVTAYGTV
jgi:hypothetical protein